MTYAWNSVNPVKYWCYKVLPLVYDDSLSYYELLCKVVNKLNELIENNEKIPEYVATMIKEYISSGAISDVVKGLLGDWILNVKYPPTGLTPAVGDGSADDTQAIQGCIDYANTNGYGCVFFPDGRYLTGALTVKSNVSLAGHDRYTTTLVFKGGVTSDCIGGNGVHDFGIYNLGLDGNAGSQVNNVNLIGVNGYNVQLDNLLLMDAYRCFEYVGVGGHLQIDNVVCGTTEHNCFDISGTSKVQMTNVMFSNLSALSDDCVISISGNNGYYQFESSAYCNLCAKISGNKNKVIGNIENANTNYTNSGSNDIEIIGTDRVFKGSDFDIDITNPIKYKTPGVLNDFFNYVPMLGRDGVSYKVLVEGANIEDVGNLREYKPVNIRERFNITEDNVDVTTYIQALEDEGSDIYFPNGTYIVGRFTKKDSSWFGAGDKSVIVFTNCSANEHCVTTGLGAFDDTTTLGAGDLWRGAYDGDGFNTFTMRGLCFKASNDVSKTEADFLLLCGTKNVLIEDITFDMGLTYGLVKGYWIFNFTGENYGTIIKNCRMYCYSQTTGENGNVIIAQATAGNIEGFEICGCYYEINDSPDETIWIAGASHHAKNVYTHDNVFNSLKGSVSPIVRYVNGRTTDNYISGAIKNNYFTGTLGERWCIQCGTSIAVDTQQEGEGYAFLEVGGNVANHIAGAGGFISVVNGSFTVYNNSAVNSTFARALACAGNGVASFSGNVLKSVTCTDYTFTSNRYDSETKTINVNLDHEDYGMYNAGGLYLIKGGTISNSRISFGSMVGTYSIRNDYGTLIVNNSVFNLPSNAPRGSINSLKASNCNFTQFYFAVLGNTGVIDIINTEFHNTGVGIITQGGTVMVKDSLIECIGSDNPVFNAAYERKAVMNTLFIVNDAVNVPGAFTFWKNIVRYNGTDFTAVADPE